VLLSLTTAIDRDKAHESYERQGHERQGWAPRLTVGDRWSRFSRLYGVAKRNSEIVQQVS